MNQANPYQTPYAYGQVVAQADLTDRLGFIRRTYFHLAGAIIALILIEFLAFALFPQQIETFATPGTPIRRGFTVQRARTDIWINERSLEVSPTFMQRLADETGCSITGGLERGPASAPGAPFPAGGDGVDRFEADVAQDDGGAEVHQGATNPWIGNQCDRIIRIDDGRIISTGEAK